MTKKKVFQKVKSTCQIETTLLLMSDTKFHAFINPCNLTVALGTIAFNRQLETKCRLHVKYLLIKNKNQL
jgi:hypothetical protein